MTAPIRKWDGSTITEPGVYLDMPIETYHDSICDGPSISSSGLRTIISQSPLHYFDTSPYNPDRPEREQKQHFALGSAVHTLLLGEHGFRDKYVVRPEHWSDWRTNAAKEWREQMLALGKTVLTGEDLEKIKGVARSMQREPIVQQGLFSGYSEASFFWKDPETGIWLKARPDSWNPDLNYIADLKTTASADRQSCERSIADFGYHQQLALVGEGVKHITGTDIPNDGYILPFVETARPYAVNLKPVDADAIWKGRALNRKAIRIAAECFKTGEWPGYPDNGDTAFLPPWINKRLDEQIESGELPNPDTLNTGKAA